MAKKFSIYWYREGPEFQSAFLYNLRDDDVQQGGKIEQGEIVHGAIGLVAAEATVFGWTGRIVPFQPNRRCEWEGFELPCMTLPSAPAGRAPASLLRNCNYAVAAVTSEVVKAKADDLKLPCVRTPGGAIVINVELTRFEGQRLAGRATLV